MRTDRLRDDIVDIEAVDRSQTARVGGKAAQLGELTRIPEIRVPTAFCVTTDAFARIVSGAASIDRQLAALAIVNTGDRAAIGALSADVRRSIEATSVPKELAAAISSRLVELGAGAAWAVRSSATAEDLPTASFAGQHDTYLNVIGAAEVLEHIRRCWASLFSERAVTYRQRHGVDHRSVNMAVVVQQMVVPHTAGVLFTADPASGNRKVAVVEASFGLGEAVVSGLVNPDVYKVRDGELIATTIGSKQRAVQALAGGGTREQPVDPRHAAQAALTDGQVVRLVEMGRRIAGHFGCPQDIEWCLVDDEVYVVQSRPITTLFPIPATDDGEHHVYVSVGHQQMMTDAMKPLGLSFWQLTSRAPMRTAGGRLFVDVTPGLASTASRDGLIDGLGRSDPLIGDALRTLVERGDFLPSLPDPAATPSAGGALPAIETDPAIVTELIARTRASIADLRSAIAEKAGAELFDFIVADLAELQRILFDPRSLQVIVAGMEASWWLNEQLHAWLGEKNVADTLAQSAPNNVTAAMGLALLDVADVIRPHPEAVRLLERAHDDSFLDELVTVDGGAAARRAIEVFLDDYGMRCVGEIDITRPRWTEHPITLVPVLLGNIKNFGQGAGPQRLQHGEQQARQKEQEVLRRLRALPDGEPKAEEAKRMIARVRTFTGYREYPKYGMVWRYFVYKQALLAEADRLVEAQVLGERDDIYFLALDEVQELVRTNRVDHGVVSQRKIEFDSYQALTPPRVLTSDGEGLDGAYRRDDVPDGALIGLPVSAGTVEGRARVISDIAAADLEPGDILVTAYTDPSWTPLFVTIAGLVTEAGGLMTHGSVIAREYGLPAVVGVEHATQLIADRRRIRLHGTDGYVELLA